MTENLYFAYCRESIDLKSGIDIQKDKIKKYCDSTGKVITNWFIDNDASAYKYRPNYEKMMIAIKDAPLCKGIICSSLSRFGRNTPEVLFAHNCLKELGKDLVFIDNNIDSNTTGGKAMLGMLAVFADFERDTIRDRLEGGKLWANIHGTKSGKPMHRPAKIIDWIKYDEYKGKGLSIPSIAKFLGVSKKTLYEKIKRR